MTTAAGDQRVRRRVATIVGQALSAAATTSRANVDIVYANRHYIAIVPNGTLTGGTVTIRGRPPTGGAAITGTQGFVPIGIEALVVNTAVNMNFQVAGFFDAFLVTIGSPITGGTIDVVVNSTIENGP